MFKGQPKKPLFKVGDLVHASSKAEAKQPPKAGFQSAFATSTKPPPGDFSLRLAPDTIFSVVSVQESTTDQQSHGYTLKPANPETLSFDVVEGQLLKTGEFEVNDFVVKKKDAANKVYQVTRVALMIEKGADNGKPIPSVVMRSELGDMEMSAAEWLRKATDQEAKGWWAPTW